MALIIHISGLFILLEFPCWSRLPEIIIILGDLLDTRFKFDLIQSWKEVPVEEKDVEEGKDHEEYEEYAVDEY